jgi:hypothetical protein
MASREVAGHRREGTMSGVEDNGHDSGHGEADAIDPKPGAPGKLAKNRR